MTARRHIKDQQDFNQNKQQANYESEQAKQNFGKTTINKLDKDNLKNTEFSDFEEIHDD